jgi:hypothetical protein
MRAITQPTLLIMTNGVTDPSIENASSNVIYIETVILDNAHQIFLVGSKTLFQELAPSDCYLLLIP